jgi:hypothetical protein
MIVELPLSVEIAYNIEIYISTLAILMYTKSEKWI